MSAGEIIAEIEKDVVFYDQSGGGATFSGGEPLMHVDFLDALLRECRARDIATAIDTSCYAEPQVIERIRESVDLFLCDLKHMDSRAHERCTGVGNELILDNMRRLASSETEMTLRIPLIPGFNDDEDNLEATGRFAASLGTVGRIDILPYNSGGLEKSARLTEEHNLLNVGPPSGAQLKAITGKLQNFGFTVGIGG
jgi:pyruvate formate lyase activating enzyme